MSTPQTPGEGMGQGPAPRGGDGLAMPQAKNGAPPVMAASPGEPKAGAAAEIGPPPSFGKQVAQLVVVPALIVLVAVGVAILFGKLAGANETLESQLLRLEQSSGAGRIVGDVQDPRYKDRGLAAYNIALMIPSIKNPGERRSLSDKLSRILRTNVDPKEENLQIYLLTAIGQLGQPGGLELIGEKLSGAPASMRRGAVYGLTSWPDRAEARAALPQLMPLLSDSDAMVRREAATAAGALGLADDAELIAGLRGAMVDGNIAFREAQWNAAVALAKLNVEEGSQFVAGVLLNRTALAQLTEGESGPKAQTKMSPSAQDRVILAALGSASNMKAKAIWDKIEGLASGDPNRKVQAAARSLLDKRAAEPK